MVATADRGRGVIPRGQRQQGMRRGVRLMMVAGAVITLGLIIVAAVIALGAVTGLS